MFNARLTAIAVRANPITEYTDTKSSFNVDSVPPIGGHPGSRSPNPNVCIVFALERNIYYK